MYILDTDHLSVLDRGGTSAQRLFQRLATIDPSDVTTTIISYEEQMRGWLSYLATAKTIEQQVNGYNQLKRQLANYCTIPVLEFNEAAAQKFRHLKQRHPRLGSMDLKIAAISSVQGAVLLTRNSRDFSQIAGLPIEDWT